MKIFRFSFNVGKRLLSLKRYNGNRWHFESNQITRVLYMRGLQESPLKLNQDKNFPSGHMTKTDVVLMSLRRDYGALTSIRRHFGTKCPVGQYLRQEFSIFDRFEFSEVS